MLSYLLVIGNTAVLVVIQYQPYPELQLKILHFQIDNPDSYLPRPTPWQF